MSREKKKLFGSSFFSFVDMKNLTKVNCGQFHGHISELTR